MNKVNFILAFFLVLLLIDSNAQKSATQPAVEQEGQQTNVWQTLSNITYVKEFDEVLGFKIDKPIFGQPIKDIEGKEITLKGYIIPVEGYSSHKSFIFSAFPYSMCFFCGGAGPETVMEVESLEPVEYTTDQIILKGKLSLNDKDFNSLMFKLTQAELVEG